MYTKRTTKPLKILIAGAGLSGCTLARLLMERGHHVELIEKEPQIGGLCMTRLDEDGCKYEPFGVHVFHSADPQVVHFVQRFSRFSAYIHRKGMVVDEQLLPFPLTRQVLNLLPDSGRIMAELSRRPEKIDMTNFESACISMFGKTLYGYFVENYSRKMWGTAPLHLMATWAPKRLELRETEDDRLFKGEWQGLPLEGYSHFLENMLTGIPVTLRTTSFHSEQYDVVASSAPLDTALDYRYGRLQYRSLKFAYQNNETWEEHRYGTINLPQHPTFIRKCNFRVVHKHPGPGNLIQYQEPVAADTENLPMYPLNTPQNEACFDRCLRALCASENICPLGRLGMFRYLDMDKAVTFAFEMADVVEKYPQLNPAGRYALIREIRSRY